MRRARAVAALLAVGCANRPQLGGEVEAERAMRDVARSTGDLHLSCSPADATVAVDGVPVGLCSDFVGQRGLQLGTRTRRLAVQKSGYYSYESVVQTDGTRLTLTVSLAPSSLEGASP